MSDEPASLAALQSLNLSLQDEIGGLHFANSVILQTLVQILDAKIPGTKESLVRSLKATWETGHRIEADSRPIAAQMLDTLQDFINSLEDK